VYEWSVAFYGTLATAWQRGLRERQPDVLLNRAGLRGGVGAADADATGIDNVRVFDEALRAGSGGALALVDLDRFKPINDELGHSAGDAALIRFTNLIRRELRPGDVFARLGGNEFGILFPNTSVDEATSILGRIYETLQRNPFHYDGHSLHFSASCGIGEMVPPVEETKKRIDAALYAAKNSGRGRWVVSERIADSG
jgi:diguanylate cyclase (GGDEF)-like protein